MGAVPRVVAPKQWQVYNDLRRAGHSRTAACRAAQISEPTARLFDYERRTEAAGIRSARRSSGWAWVAWRAELRRLDAEPGGERASA